MNDAPLRHSPLHDRHQRLGAKFAAFGGWDMPLEYAGGGVLKEHAAVREAVGVFDVSHLGKATVRGPGAVDFLNRTLTNDLNKIASGKAQYTLCCDDSSGGVVDDLIAYRFADDHVFLIPNAANTAEVVRRLRAASPPDITITNDHLAYAVLALQGPRSAEVLAALAAPSDHDYMTFVEASVPARPVDAEGAPIDIPVVVCRTGYTGEHGYELVVAADAAGLTWDALFDAGESFGIRACGLGARDTLRTEMGYPLHGQDLSMDITPVQARAGWAVGWGKPEFWGRSALVAEKESGARRSLVGLESVDRGIPRPHMAVMRGEDVAGEVTSGTFSPTKRVGIALALLDNSFGLTYGDEVEIDLRGRRGRMKVVKPPFVSPSVRA